VSHLADGPFAAGEHALVWNGRAANGLEAPTGVYFIVLETPSTRSVRKALLMK